MSIRTSLSKTLTTVNQRANHIGKHVNNTALEVNEERSFASNCAEEPIESQIAGQGTSMRLKNAAEGTKDWIMKHPGTTTGLVGCVVAGPLAIVAAPVALCVAGFGASGVLGGSMAAGIHAGIGSVVAGSAFAILQSAGAGGAGLATVNAVAGTTAFATAVAATTPGLIKAVRESREGNGAQQGEEINGEDAGFLGEDELREGYGSKDA